jgi:hypothetical protein
MTVHWPPVLEVSAFPAFLLSLFLTPRTRGGAHRHGISARFCSVVPNQDENGCRFLTVSAKILLTRHVSERTADPIQISGFSSRIGEIHGSQLKENKSAPHFLKIVRFRAFVGNPVAHGLITFCSF